MKSLFQKIKKWIFGTGIYFIEIDLDKGGSENVLRMFKELDPDLNVIVCSSPPNSYTKITKKRFRSW